MFFPTKSNEYDESSDDSKSIDANSATIEYLEKKAEQLAEYDKKLTMVKAFSDGNILKFLVYYNKNRPDKALKLLKELAQNTANIKKINHILTIDKKYLDSVYISIQNFIRDIINHDNELSTIYNSDPSLTSTITTFKP